MKGFFDDTELRIFSLEEKITWILDKIIFSFFIEETKKETIRYYDYIRKKNRSYIVIYSTIPLNLEQISKLHIPFDGITIKNNKDSVCISGKDFSYTFSIDMILTIRKRFNKIKPKVK